MGSRKKDKYFLSLGLIGIILFFTFVSRVLAAKFDRIPPAPVSVPGAEYVGTESCVACHEKESKDFDRSAHGKFAVSGQEAQAEGCEMCHGAGSKHVDAGGTEKGLIINPKKDPQSCFQCHPENKAQFSLQYHHPVLEGKVSCNDCHNPHAEDAGTATLEGPNETCFKCHPEQKGPFVYEHDVMREGCTICHTPHGSINDKLMVAGDNNICLNCHYEQAFPVIGDFAIHGTAMAQTPSNLSRGKQNCFRCHNAVHGSNFSSTLLNE